MNTPIRVCPRCGHPYSYIKEKRVNGRVYLYAVHCVKDASGRVRTTECYLGPKDQYEYVTKMHMREGLILKGLMDQERAVQYLCSIINHMINIELEEDLAKFLINFLKEAAHKLEKKYQ